MLLGFVLLLAEKGLPIIDCSTAIKKMFQIIRLHMLMNMCYSSKVEQ